MKVIIYIFYFFRSVALRGLINTIKLIRAEVKGDEKYGIVTTSIKESKSTEFYHYQGASYLVLNRIFDKIAKETSHFDFIDIGCGKGRPAFVAETFGYKNILGIDLDAELVEQANLNLKNYKATNDVSHLRFITANALTYAYENKPCVYFLFNPFNASVLEKVLDKILSSTHSETYFIYMNPTCASVFKPEKFKVVSALKTKKYLEAIVYKICY